MSFAPVRLPTDKLALVLAGLTAEGSARLPFEERDGWLFFRWDGLAGGQGQVGVRVDDVECLAALERAGSEPRAFVELWALLGRLLGLAGRVGEWRLERVAELLYGPRTDSSHRERQLPGLHGWMALLERGWWQLDGAVDPKAGGRGRKRGGPGYGGTFAGGHLVEVERLSRSRATVRLAPVLSELAGKGFVEVPAGEFRLPREDHRNPEGNLPSLAARARARIAGAIAGRWRQYRDQPIRLEDILTRFGGMDLSRVRRRRREGSWFDVITSDLAGAFGRGGVGLERCPPPDRPVFRTLLHLIIPSGERSVRQTAPARAPA